MSNASPARVYSTKLTAQSIRAKLAKANPAKVFEVVTLDAARHQVVEIVKVAKPEPKAPKAVTVRKADNSEVVSLVGRKLRETGAWLILASGDGLIELNKNALVSRSDDGNTVSVTITAAYLASRAAAASEFLSKQPTSYAKLLAA